MVLESVSVLLHVKNFTKTRPTTRTVEEWCRIRLSPLSVLCKYRESRGFVSKMPEIS